MTLKTIPIRINLLDPDGSFAAGAAVTATLVNAVNLAPAFDCDSGDGVLVPAVVRGTADNAGSLLMQLWPNALGTRGTAYRVEATLGGTQLLAAFISVPNSTAGIEVPIESLFNIPPYPSLDAAQAAVLTAQAAAVAADQSADAAALDAIATAADRVQTGLDRTAASGSASAADASADAAALDAIATAADRVQTGLDAASASASAGTATTQAGIATTQAGNASASAVSAAASFDSFDDRYLGAKAAAPTLDNDGAALLTGALYWDTVLGALRVWTGAEWTNTTELDDRVLADQQLLGGIEYATDMALQAVRELLLTSANVLTYDLTLEQMLNALAHLLDLAGVTARAIAGGDVILRAGTADGPSLRPDGDPNTGVFFPAADVTAVATAGLERLRVDASGNLGIGTTAPSGLLDVNDNRLRVRTAKTPASATAAGNAGEFCWDASYLYVCTSANVWRRTAHATW